MRRLEAKNSKERGADQTAAAIFSLATPAQLFGPAARAAVLAKGPSVTDNARTLAVMQVAGVDALITGWELKKRYSLWRPFTAIRNAASNPEPN